MLEFTFSTHSCYSFDFFSSSFVLTLGFHLDTLLLLILLLLKDLVLFPFMSNVIVKLNWELKMEMFEITIDIENFVLDWTVEQLNLALMNGEHQISQWCTWVIASDFSILWPQANRRIETNMFLWHSKVKLRTILYKRIFILDYGIRIWRFTRSHLSSRTFNYRNRFSRSNVLAELYGPFPLESKLYFVN